MKKASIRLLAIIFAVGILNIAFSAVLVADYNRAALLLRYAATVHEATAYEATAYGDYANVQPATSTIFGLNAVSNADGSVIFISDIYTGRLNRVNSRTFEINYITFGLNLVPEAMFYRNGRLYVALRRISYHAHDPSRWWWGYGAFAIVNTATFTVIAQHNVDFDPFQIVVSSAGNIYIAPGFGGGGWLDIVGFRPNGTAFTRTGIWQASTIRYNSALNRIYTITSDLSPRSMDAFHLNANGTFGNTFRWRYHGDFESSTHFEITPDGRYIFNAIGYRLRLSANPIQDMVRIPGNISPFIDIAFGTDTYYIAASDGWIDVYCFHTHRRLYEYNAHGLPTHVFLSGNDIVFIAISPHDGRIWVDRITRTRAPEILTPAPPAGRVGVAYGTNGQGYQFRATGYPNPTWSFTGTLPPGLSLNSAGLLSGTPTAMGNFTFTVRATNSIGQDSRVVTIAINAPPSIANAAPPAGSVDVAYGAFGEGYLFRATGHPAPTWSFTGTLPPGLSLGPHGSLSGIPTAMGNFTFTAIATNSAGQASQVITITINASPSIATPAPPPGIVSIAFGSYGEGYQFTATGYPAPTWSFNGSLPPGLSLSPEGLLSGVPTGTGSFTFTITATNAVGNNNREITVVITEISQIVGDVNSDGRVTSADATLLARYLAGHFDDIRNHFTQSDAWQQIADVNGDGYVTSADLILLVQLLMGYSPTG